jgi:predicted nucleotidyltransferase
MIIEELNNTFETLREIVRAWNLEPLFMTLSGVHLYGFPSIDSDYDLRGAYVLPLREVIGLHKPEETLTRLEPVRDLDIDLVFHDIGKFVRLLISGNASLLEELYSPLVLSGEGELATLRELAKGCFTRHLYHHYSGFAHAQIEKLWSKEVRPVKTLLYCYRILMTGILLLESGVLECNLPALNERFGLSFIPDLIAAKINELSPLHDTDWDLHRRTLQELRARMRRAWRSGSLPERSTQMDALEDYLVQRRIANGKLL